MCVYIYIYIYIFAPYILNIDTNNYLITQLNKAVWRGHCFLGK